MKHPSLRFVIVSLLLLSLIVSPGKAQGIPLVITPDAASKSGEPGTTVTFNLTLTARSSGTYWLTTDNRADWTVNIPSGNFELDAGEVASATAEVEIPPNAQSGESIPVYILPNGNRDAMVTLVVNVVQVSSARPIVVIGSYYTDEDTVTPGQSFGLFLSLKNTGGMDAHNLIFTFAGEEFAPEETGGVVAVNLLSAGQGKDISQRLRASTSLWGKTSGSVPVTVSYNDPTGQAFSESFVVSIPVLGWSGTWATATPTPTGTQLPRAQLVVSSYNADVDPLQPGSIFNLELEVQNLGSGAARDVTMVLGGGAAPSVSETPSPGGGVSGAGADLSIFAPLGSSNLQFLDDLAVGDSARTTQKLIVNVSANPGAYTLKISFVYSDDKGNRQVDDQIITMLIYQMPQVEVNYYRDPGPITAMQPNTLPLQVVNLGRKLTVLGNMTVSAEGADLMNNVSLVGTLDAGGYFPLDVMLIPLQAGPLDVKIVINYTDDFNQTRSIEQVLNIEVQEGAPVIEDPGMEPGLEPGMEPGMGPDGMPGGMPGAEETLWQKVLRFLKGLVGLDSAPAQPATPEFPGEMPPGEEPMPLPANPGGKG